MSEKPLVCPGCGSTYPASDRFCESCAMPLVHVPGAESKASERQRKARKIKPQYADGRLVKVARAENQPEAEFIEALLLEEGIPSMLRRSGGFDVPDFLAAGPRHEPQRGGRQRAYEPGWSRVHVNIIGQ